MAIDSDVFGAASFVLFCAFVFMHIMMRAFDHGRFISERVIDEAVIETLWRRCQWFTEGRLHLLFADDETLINEVTATMQKRLQPRGLRAALGIKPFTPYDLIRVRIRHYRMMYVIVFYATSETIGLCVDDDGLPSVPADGQSNQN